VRIVVLRAPTVAGRADRARRSRAQTAADPLDAAQTQGYGHWALEVDDLDEAFALLSAAPVRAPVVRPRAVNPSSDLGDPDGGAGPSAAS
jgi:hypothetical protein